MNQKRHVSYMYLFPFLFSTALITFQCFCQAARNIICDRITKFLLMFDATLQNHTIELKAYHSKLFVEGHQFVRLGSLFFGGKHKHQHFLILFILFIVYWIMRRWGRGRKVDDV